MAGADDLGPHAHRVNLAFIGEACNSWGVMGWPRLGDRLALGGSGLDVSPFCVGMVADPDAIGAAFDAGINFFFLSADMHWPRYDASRRGLARLLERVPRERVVVAVAAYVTQPEFCRMPFEEVLDAVPGLGTIDVLVAGGAYAGDLAGRWPVYQRHRAERFAGARALGVSFHDRAAALAAVNGVDLELAFIRYNTSHPGAREDLFPELAPGRTARLFGFKTTGGHEPHGPDEGHDDELWLPELTDHYRFALSRQPGLDGLLCSPSEPWMVAELADAMGRGPLEPEEEAHMLALAGRRMTGGPKP